MSDNYTPNPIQGFEAPLLDNPYFYDSGQQSPTISIDRTVQCIVTGFTSSLSTGDGKFYFHIDRRLNGKRIVDVHAQVITAGTTGTTDIQIANVTKSVDILTTKLKIDSGETGSDTAATKAVIGKNNGVTLNDLIRIDIDAVSTTPPQGLIVTLGFN